MRGATSHDSRSNYRTDISTHAPHAGSDTATITARATKAHFNPHLLCGRRRGKKYFSSPSVVFQSPPPMREATREPFGWRYGSEFQPTLPMRGATCCSDPCDQAASISTHAPHAGSDADNVYNAISAGQFQPTLPMRGATRSLTKRSASTIFQPTLPMRGATKARGGKRVMYAISTHAPHAGSDTRPVLQLMSDQLIFQPTLPMRGATVSLKRLKPRPDISTHAPHAGSDRNSG